MQKTLLAAASVAVLTFAGAAQAQDWTGADVGVSAGYADRNDNSSETILFDTNQDGVFSDTVRTTAGADAFSTGFCGGAFNTNAAPGGCKKDDTSDVEWSVRAGYDRQIGSFVLGAVIEYGRMELQDTVTAFSTTPASYAFTRKLNELYAARLRAGFAMDSNLFYATGGLALGEVKSSFRTTNGVNAFPARGGGKTDGYQIGAGYERMLTPTWVVGAEFLRTDLSGHRLKVRASNNGTTAATNPFLLVNGQGTDFLRSEKDIEFNSYKITASYRF